MLPDSIPTSLWDEFRKMRKKIKAPMTEHAETLILCKLEKWRVENGANPIDILNESIEKSWRGVFLNGHGQPGQRGTAAPSHEGHAAGVARVQSCKKCGRTDWVSLDRYKVCSQCQEGK